MLFTTATCLSNTAEQKSDTKWFRHTKTEWTELIRDGSTVKLSSLGRVYEPLCEHGCCGEAIVLAV